MANLEERHSWTRAMRALTFALLDREAAGPFVRVLDAGCGTGLFLDQWLAGSKAKFGVGIDFNAEALKWAKNRPRGTWAVASAADLPFPPETFDGIHSADVLQHMTIEESLKALDLFASLLRPGGLVALRLRAPRILRKEADIDYSHAFSIPYLKAELTKRGLEPRFLSHVNALPSLWGEVSSRLRPKPRDTSVQGIQVRSGVDAASRLLAAYLSIENAWHRWIRIPLPMGHTILCVARKKI